MFEAIINKYLKIYLQSTDFYENSHTRIPYCSINIKADLIIFLVQIIKEVLSVIVNAKFFAFWFIKSSYI